MIKLLFFGRLSELAYDAPAIIKATSINEVIDMLKVKHPLLAKELNAPQVLVAVNHKLSDCNVVLKPGDALTFMSPVTGG
ncbi:MAG: MoaD/ThiS family protein [Porticoccaceae bacterium]|nr:MoaD/ThiS family protein [Porticoccaceae bacterium]